MLALLFPGQGSQKVGMAKFLYEEFDIAKKTLEEASDILSLNMKELLFEDPNKQLNLTKYTQPALVTASTIYHRVLQDRVELPPLPSAGHSLGEYSALVANQVLSFEDALKLTYVRGEAMQEAVPVGKGSMLAVMGLSDVEVEKLCSIVNEKISLVEPANFNSPGQVVVSGTSEACDHLKKLDTMELLGKKSKMIPLKVSAPFHCSLMMPAQKVMEEKILACDFQPAKAAIIQNYDAKEHSLPEELKKNLCKQITGSVRWTSSILRMKELGVTTFIEMGPGKVLSGLVKKIDSESLKALNIENLEDLSVVKMHIEDL